MRRKRGRRKRRNSKRKKNKGGLRMKRKWNGEYWRVEGKGN